MLAEDVEDDSGAVDDLDLDDVLERTPLAWGELAVDDHSVGAGCRDDATQLLGLALAEIGAGVGVRPALEQPVEDYRSGGFGEGEQLAHGVFGLDDEALAVDADQHDALDAKLAVLDLCNVFELGREPGNASQRLAVLTLGLVTVVRVLAVLVEASRLESLGSLRREDGVAGGLRRRVREHSVDDVVVIAVLHRICLSHWVNPSLSSFGRFC